MTKVSNSLARRPIRRTMLRPLDDDTAAGPDSAADDTADAEFDSIANDEKVVVNDDEGEGTAPAAADEPSGDDTGELRHVTEDESRDNTAPTGDASAPSSQSGSDDEGEPPRKFWG